MQQLLHHSGSGQELKQPALTAPSILTEPWHRGDEREDATVKVMTTTN